MASIARSAPTSRATCSLQYLRKTQSRTLSTSRSRSAQGAQGSQSGMMRNMPKQASLGTRMKRMKRSEIPTDIGLIPNTYVRPCGDMPSWFSGPLLRLQLEWLYIKQSTTDFMTSTYSNRWSVPKDANGRRKAKPLSLRERCSVARDLHKRFYIAAAEGDRHTLNKVACAGLINNQITRLDNARMNDIPPATWKVKYRGWTLTQKLPFTIQSLIPSWFKAFHVIADRQTQLPVGPGLTVRQVILRVDSTQTVDRNDGSDPITRKMREYLVLQRTMMEDEIDEWKIWGTLDPTDTAGAREIINMNKDETGSMTDRMRSVFPGML